MFQQIVFDIEEDDDEAEVKALDAFEADELDEDEFDELDETDNDNGKACIEFLKTVGDDDEERVHFDE